MAASSAEKREVTVEPNITAECVQTSSRCLWLNAGRESKRRMESQVELVTGIDPGTTHSGWVTLDGMDVVEAGYDENETLASMIRDMKFANQTIGIEMIASYGMPAGESLFETVYWIGVFDECSSSGMVKNFYKIYRKQDREFPGVCMYICKNNKAKDANIKRAILDMYEPTGGGAEGRVGTKKEPGPLFKLKGLSHCWQAMAVAITCRDNLSNLT